MTDRLTAIKERLETRRHYVAVYTDLEWAIAEIERLQPPAMANRINELLEDRRKQDAYIERLREALWEINNKVRQVDVDEEMEKLK